MREQTLVRQKKLGIVPADTELPPINPDGIPDSRTGPDLFLSASFEKESQEQDCTTGTLTLYHGEEKVGEGPVKAQLGAFAIAGSGLCVGRQEGEVITDDYPGEAPHRFTGGTINELAIDVSGEAYIDLEREAALMLMRE